MHQIFYDFFYLTNNMFSKLSQDMSDNKDMLWLDNMVHIQSSWFGYLK